MEAVTAWRKAVRNFHKYGEAGQEPANRPSPHWSPMPSINTAADDHHINLSFGNGSFGVGKKEIRAPRKRLSPICGKLPDCCHQEANRPVRPMVTLIMVDEYINTQICSCYQWTLEHVPEVERSGSHEDPCCPLGNSCRTVCNRDVMIAKNIHHIFKYMAEHNNRWSAMLCWAQNDPDSLVREVAADSSERPRYPTLKYFVVFLKPTSKMVADLKIRWLHCELNTVDIFLLLLLLPLFLALYDLLRCLPRSSTIVRQLCYGCGPQPLAYRYQRRCTPTRCLRTSSTATRQACCPCPGRWIPSRLKKRASAGQVKQNFHSNVLFGLLRLLLCRRHMCCCEGYSPYQPSWPWVSKERGWSHWGGIETGMNMFKSLVPSKNKEADALFV